MSASTVLVTGVTRFLGSSLAGRLAALPHVRRVIGVDAALPDADCRDRMGGAEFVRVDIRGPLISRLIDGSDIDTVVHASATASPSSPASRTMVKEMNVLGTMQLLAACQRARQVKRLVVRSTAAVYGGSPRDPAVFTEDTEPLAVPTSGPARDAVDIEGYLRGFIRRRPDVAVAAPRFAEIIGPTVRTPLTRYFSLSPLVPVLIGRDPRLQLVHEQDAVDLMMHLALGDYAGFVNVAGSGTMTVTQAIHRAGRLPLPLPPGTLGLLGRSLRSLRVGGFSPEQVTLLARGRTLDTSRLREDVGFVLRFSTEAAFAAFAAGLIPVIDPALLRGAEQLASRLLGIRPAVVHPAAVDPTGARPPGATATAARPPRQRAGRPHLVSIDGQRRSR